MSFYESSKTLLILIILTWVYMCDRHIIFLTLRHHFWRHNMKNIASQCENVPKTNYFLRVFEWGRLFNGRLDCGYIIVRTMSEMSLNKVWRYQTINQKPSIAEGQTIYCPKEKEYIKSLKCFFCNNVNICIAGAIIGNRNAVDDLHFQRLDFHDETWINRSCNLPICSPTPMLSVQRIIWI